MTVDVDSILIVDDQAGIRHLLLEALSNEGYRLEIAASGPEALKKISDRGPSIVLLDIKMPGMNGLDTLEELRKIAPETTVVIMTAYGELDIITEAKKMGVQHYIVKPFDLNEVRYLIKGLFAEMADIKEPLKEIG